MVAGRRRLLNVLSVGSDMGQRFCHEENGRSWRASGYVRLYAEAVFMPDRNRGPVTRPAAAVKKRYTNHMRGVAETKLLNRLGVNSFVSRQAAAMPRKASEEMEAKNHLEASLTYERIIPCGKRDPPGWYLSTVQATSQIHKALEAHAYNTVAGLLPMNCGKIIMLGPTGRKGSRATFGCPSPVLSSCPLGPRCSCPFPRFPSSTAPASPLSVRCLLPHPA